MKRFLLLLPALLCACTIAHKPVHDFAPQADASLGSEMNDVAIYAVSMAETPYHYGGNSPQEGFDCSGFVQYVYEQVTGWKLPRTSREMGREGKPVSQAHLLPGDLVFFNTQHRPFSHVGIYVGNGRFVHAPRTGKSVTIVNMKVGYWRSRYDGARRIILRRSRYAPETALR